MDWGDVYECVEGAVCQNGVCSRGICGNACQDDTECGGGYSCQRIHHNEDASTCMRSCDLGCHTGTFCSDEYCQPKSPSGVCNAELDGVLYRDGCGIIDSEDDCPNGNFTCVGRACVPSGLQCGYCGQGIGCNENHVCVIIESGLAEDGTGYGTCLALCDDIADCPPPPNGNPGWHCYDVLADGHSFTACYPLEANHCFEGNLHEYLCERPIQVEQACPADCNREGCQQ